MICSPKSNRRILSKFGKSVQSWFKTFLSHLSILRINSEFPTKFSRPYMTKHFPTSLPSSCTLFPFFTLGSPSCLIPTTRAPAWEPWTMACSHSALLHSASPFPAFSPVFKPCRENLSILIYVLSLYCFFMIYPFPEEKVVCIKLENLICSLLHAPVQHSAWHRAALEKIYTQ